MLQLSASLLNRPVLSLRTGGQVAFTIRAIINPNNLKIEGFYCQDTLDKRQPVLVSLDIREIIPQGLIINDYDVLCDVEELVRLQDVLKINFELLGKPVYTVNKERLGKVDDFAADSETLYIQKLYVSRPLLKSFGTGQIGIDRTQIVEITNSKIIVQDLLQMSRSGVPAGAPAA